MVCHVEPGDMVRVTTRIDSTGHLHPVWVTVAYLIVESVNGDIALLMYDHQLIGWWKTKDIMGV